MKFDTKNYENETECRMHGLLTAEDAEDTGGLISLFAFPLRTFAPFAVQILLFLPGGGTLSAN